ERLDRSRGACRGRLAVPAAPHLPVAHPDGLAVALLDMRRAVEQGRGQPRGPQIRGQLAEVHVIVTGDEPVSHVVLRSMNVFHGHGSVASTQLAVVPADHLLRDDLEYHGLGWAGHR